ncbi:HAD family hydrolase [Rickettsiella endosymbiont of Miltochrista miniata]|uniref:HAD family hydrolase n=1 Tax=Rickettsiella endosymbiont of Miltochrista miniata TaxID=3066239 RepID=UPI00313A8BAD
MLSLLLANSKRRLSRKAEFIKLNAVILKDKIPILYKVLKKTYFLAKKIQFASQNKTFNYKIKITSLNDVLYYCDPYDIISFDFFDTLVHRIISPPDAVKIKTAEYACLKLKQLGCYLNVEHFNKIRNSTEKKLRDHSFDQHGKDRETDIFSIIEQTLSQILQKKLIDLTREIITYEIKNEINHLYLSKEIEVTMSKLKKKGKKIIVCSDMYLCKEHLEEIAKHFGIASYVDRFYVSSTKKITKGSGRLYQFVLEDLAIDSKKILHVGDNLFSDVISAEKLGIKSLYYHNKEVLKQYKQLSAWHNPKKYHQKSAKNSLIKHYIAKKNYPFDDYREISHFIAPVLSVFAYQSLLDMHSLGIKKIFFLAREGLLLQKIFTEILNKVLLFQDLKKNLTFKVIYISRLTSACAIYNNKNLNVLIENCIYATGYLSILNFIYTFGLSLKDFSNESIEIIEPYLNNIDKKTFIHLFNTTIFGIEIDRLLKNNIDYLKRYLSEQGVLSEGRVGIVDLGWGGTIQKNIGYLLQDYPATKLFGFYFGTNSLITNKNNPSRKRSTFFPGYIISYQNDYQNRKLNGVIPFLESVCGCDKIGTTLAYKENKAGLVVPIFENRKNFQEKNHFNCLFQEHLLNHLVNDAKAFSRLFNIACLPLGTLKDYTTKRFLKFIYNPKMIDLKKLHNYQFNYNWSSRSAKPLINLIRFSDVFRPITLLRKIQTSPWRYGSMAVAPIPFLLTFYNLGHYFLHYFYSRIKHKMMGRLLKKRI